MKYLIILVSIFIAGCARQQTIGLQSHQFNASPRNIIWFQVPGLTNEHLALLRFSLGDAQVTTAFEDMVCSGTMWSFNLNELRPEAAISYLSQMTSRRAITASCENLPEESIWTFLREQGYSMGLYEYGANEVQSYERTLECTEHEESWKRGVHFWLSKKAPEGQENFFHFQELSDLKGPGVYYDTTCQGRQCFADFQSNVNSLWRRFRGDRGRAILIIRDFSYLNALLRKDLVAARERLVEIEKTLSSFTRNPDVLRESLVLLTSAQGVQLEFPAQGQQWREFEASGRHVVFRNTTLVSPAFAWGQRSENFCGQYPENQILARILFTPRDLSPADRLRELWR